MTSGDRTIQSTTGPARTAPLVVAVFGALAGLVVVAAAALGLESHGFAWTPRTFRALAVLAASPALVPLALAVVLTWLRPRAGARERFASMLIGVPLAGLASAAAIFVVQHVATYPQPLPLPFSEHGLYFLAWSAATALYLFLVEIRLYLPWAPPALVVIAAGWAWAGRR